MSQEGRAEDEEGCCVISFHAKNTSEMTDGNIMGDFVQL